ncbi:hypothetical protein PtA15_2A118 [Puccinia triticina]|uniref:Uncharacterized protein n=2 Tax=Puccinia triticina TaxID=208348 RepID=A0ABY7CCD6_9BASI|nr:uncharacterized protein PtA15_2A118 [Puccinia triticina]WAQ81806.1 hypothetical protein PtA15_2A118 [Puccinia triticina]
MPLSKVLRPFISAANSSPPAPRPSTSAETFSPFTTGAEAIYLCGNLFATGTFPSYHPKDPLFSFRDLRVMHCLAAILPGSGLAGSKRTARTGTGSWVPTSSEKCACVYRLGMS